MTPPGSNRLAADPAYALEGPETDARRESPWRGRLRRRRAAALAFCTYAGPRDFWAALHSVLFLVAASLVFGRIPKLPVAVLVLIPFIYTSALGALLLLAGLAHDRVVGRLLRRLGRKLCGRDDFFSSLARDAGQRLLRTAFGVGVYLLLGLIYLALGPADNYLGWLLLPCLLIGLAAIYSLGRQAELTQAERENGGAAPAAGLDAGPEDVFPAAPEKTPVSFGRAFGRGLLRRVIYMICLAASLYLLSRYLFKVG